MGTPSRHLCGQRAGVRTHPGKLGEMVGEGARAGSQPREERSGSEREQQRSRVPPLRGWTHRGSPEDNCQTQRTGLGMLGRPMKRDQRVNARSVAEQHPRLVELLQTGRLAARSGRSQRRDTTPCAQKLLAAFASSPRAIQCSAAAGNQTSQTGSGQVWSWRLGNGPTRRDAASTQQPHAQSLWVHRATELRGSARVTATMFNRRIRKTARPAVWEI